MKHYKILLPAAVVIAAASVFAQAQTTDSSIFVQNLTQFQAGTPASAAQVNENFRGLNVGLRSLANAISTLQFNLSQLTPRVDATQTQATAQQTQIETLLVRQTALESRIAALENPRLTTASVVGTYRLVEISTGHNFVTDGEPSRDQVAQLEGETNTGTVTFRADGTYSGGLTNNQNSVSVRQNTSQSRISISASPSSNPDENTDRFGGTWRIENNRVITTDGGNSISNIVSFSADSQVLTVTTFRITPVTGGTTLDADMTIGVKLPAP